MRVDDLARFIIARDTVRVKKEAGEPKPWTDDPILQTYRFCNVRREDDAVSVWIRTRWREPYSYDKNLWFAMVVARLFNQPDALQSIGYPTPWRRERVRKILHKRKEQGERNFNAAYIVSTNGLAMDKVDYVLDRVLQPMWDKRVGFMNSLPGATLAQAHELLMGQQGMGSFMAAQVVADLKYTPVLSGAEDWARWAAPGPGSKRGLNRVRGMDPDTPWGRSWLGILQELREAILPKLPKHLKLHAQDLQNCLCEFDKYERIRLGEGRPKQLYPGAA